MTILFSPPAIVVTADRFVPLWEAGGHKENLLTSSGLTLICTAAYEE